MPATGLQPASQSPVSTQPEPDSRTTHVELAPGGAGPGSWKEGGGAGGAGVGGGGGGGGQNQYFKSKERKKEEDPPGSLPLHLSTLHC